MLYSEKPIVSVLDASIFDNAEEFNKAYSAVNEQRRKKVDACRIMKDKKLSLAAGVLLESELRKLGAEQYEIQCSEKGKPYLSGSDIHFNLSHSGNLAACAMYADEVGIDIQQVSDVGDALIKKVTTEREYESIAGLGEEARREAFFRIWTVKESYLKYLGEGLNISMSRLEVSTGEKIRIKQDGEGVDVVFSEYNIEGYKLMVCYSSLS